MEADQWLDAQEEFEERAKLNEAVQSARDAGVNVMKVIGDALVGYKNLKKFSKDEGFKDFQLSRKLVDEGVYSEYHAVMKALANATAAALKNKTP